NMEDLARRTPNCDDSGHADGALTMFPEKDELVQVELLQVDGEDELRTRRIQLTRDCDACGDGDAATVAVDLARGPPTRWRGCACWGKEGDSSTAEGRSPLSKGRADNPEKKQACRGLGLLYALLSSTIFSFVAFLVKTIDGVHSVEISAIRCFFQVIFTLPAMIYYKTGFIGPRGQRVYLFLRGFLGSNAMILLFYAVQQMPLADATVIVFSNPVFTSLLAWIFLKEKCTLWDFVFTLFTLTGVILIARPPFLFGSDASGMEEDYTNHIKGTIAAVVAAIGAACTLVVLRKMGKSVHYYLSVWYYAIIGFIECIIVLFIIDEWTVPYCGWDRWILMLIGFLGIIGQTFLTKALHIEKAGPVALMRTMDVVLAFLLQFFFLGRSPTWWSLGGALCVIGSTTGVALKKWYSSTRKS
ncbi:solute carrier family 35 member G1, partial [Arapaima gigas]